MVNQIVNNRSEILFWFETNFNNPNGDPNFENKPRVDETDGRCLISPYRLKRTIRDYLRLYYNERVLINDYNSISQEYFDFNKIKFKGDSSELKEIQDILLENFIDVRLFGIALPLKGRNKSIENYGSVQFSYAKSVHPVTLIKNQGTAAFASGSNKRNRSFRSEYIIPYSLFSLYGVINENTGAKNRLTTEDCIKLDSSLWNGINTMQSRSKTGHKSRLYLRIEYSKNNFQLKLSKNPCSIMSNLEGIKLRKIEQLQLNIQPLLELLNQYKINIKSIRVFEESMPIKDYKDIFSALDEVDIKHEKIDW